MNDAARPPGCPVRSHCEKRLVNIHLCDMQATANRNSYVPLRPQQNGRLGAEPDTAIYFEPPGKSRAALFCVATGGSERNHVTGNALSPLKSERSTNGDPDPA